MVGTLLNQTSTSKYSFMKVMVYEIFHHGVLKYYFTGVSLW